MALPEQKKKLLKAKIAVGHWFRLIPMSPLNSFDLFFGGEQHSPTLLLK
jgi:hypothetical protein